MERTWTGAGRFARAWSEALRGAWYGPLTAAQRDELLVGLTGRLAGALTAARFDPADARRVGAELFAAGFAAPEVLGRSTLLVSTRLAGELGLPRQVGSRLPELVAALADGFTTALRDRERDAQDSVRVAALSAQAAKARAEQRLRESEARLHRFASVDPVTGLPNRAVFTFELGRLLATASWSTRLGVCCLDLDRFGAVNDSLGLPAGNRLLQAVAERLQAAAADDALVARFESDQFAILVADTASGDDLAKVADRALAALAEPFVLDGVEQRLTACAGLTEGPAAGAHPGELIQAAQTALHWATAAGARGEVHWFDPARSAADAARYRLSTAMPRALDTGELTLAYQPLVDLSDRRLVGVEALARWRHPTRGELTAGEFIGLAEDIGVAVSLGNRLLAQACRQAASWHRRAAQPPYVSVNLAACQLRDPGLAGYLAQLLDHHRLPARLLQLEVTEQAIVDLGEATATLEALVRLGVRIAVDDFGTGYSNLARLSGLPLHTLKLDASLARCGRPPESLPGAGRRDAFLASVVACGHALGLSVTAEGIESAADADRMRAAGCQVGQGWHLGRPAPAHLITGSLDPAGRQSATWQTDGSQVASYHIGSRRST